MYKKRSGTSGIRGQLYETKLISLINFRAKYDNHIKQYNLATNVDEVGTFDDICFKAKVKVKGRDRAVAVFIQAKHREGDKVLTLNSKNDLAKYFDSYLSIRRAFKPDSKNILFKGNFDETDCLFVMYTTAKDDLNNIPFESDFAPKLNSLIGTGANGLQPLYKDEDVKFLCEIIMKEQFVTVAEQMAKFLSEEGDPIMSMNDDLVLLYHVILAQKVIDVSEIQFRNEEKEHRIASFRQNFFNSDEEFLISFKDALYLEMLKKRKLEENEINPLLIKFFDDPFEITIFSKLIVNVITYNNKVGKLEFVSKSMSEDMKRRLDKVNVLQSTVDEAIESAAKSLLETRRFNVPAAFGNKDLTIRGKIDVNVESILDNLKIKIVDLIQQSPPENIITIDQSLGDEFLQLNAGLASAVGNVLIFDQDTKLLKFADKSDLQGNLAKRLFAKVQSEIQNLHEYKFRVEVNTFPKHSFEKDDNQDLEMLKDQVSMLAERIGKFICKEDESIMSMDDKLVLRYHVILAQKVIDVSEIQCRKEDKEHRIASFRKDFFESDEELIINK